MRKSLTLQECIIGWWCIISRWMTVLISPVPTWTSVHNLDNEVCCPPWIDFCSCSRRVIISLISANLLRIVLYKSSYRGFFAILSSLDEFERWRIQKASPLSTTARKVITASQTLDSMRTIRSSFRHVNVHFHHQNRGGHYFFSAFVPTLGSGSTFRHPHQ